jgi:hypothetical protein
MSFAVVAAVAQVVGAIGEYQSGQSKKRMYDMQAKQVSVEAERKAVQYRQQANQVLRKQGATNAAIVARGAAGGVDPFSGSADVIRRAADTAAGREFEITLANADAALRGGAIQAQLYEAAGDQAGRAGAFSAVSKLAMAAASAGGKPSKSESAMGGRIEGSADDPAFRDSWGK